MRFLGIFENETPVQAEGVTQKDVFLLKMSSPIYDRYELWYIDGGLWRGTRMCRVYDDNSGLITCFHRRVTGEYISATTLFSKHSPRRRFTRDCNTLQEAIDLVIENFFRHTVYSEIPSDPSTPWEPCVYKGKEFFNYRTGGSYYSGYRRHTGKVYATSSLGRSIIKGEELTIKEVADYFRTLERLGKQRGNK